ncbi:hypothetical protein HID58_078525 [Brassica napus]|uniref:Defensin-like protein n=1 Tax=Brassica napus TaxID=3708 RepID=A0ABQ7YUC2_BRANA|nr:hypothetical protein HID58_078525 [Brassica napus]
MRDARLSTGQRAKQVATVETNYAPPTSNASSIHPLWHTCYYTCGPPSPTPPHHKQCYGGTGLCSSACNQNCAQKYLGGSGFCESIGISRLCKCQYPC